MDGVNSGTDGHTQGVVGFLEAVQYALIEDGGIPSQHGVGGIAQVVVEVADAGGIATGGVHVATGTGDVRVQQRLSHGFLDNLSGVSADGASGANAQFTSLEVGFELV